MKKTTLILILSLLPIAGIFAQGYRTAAGLRLGTGQGSGIGVTVNQKLWDRTSLEVIFQPSINNQESTLDILMKSHQKVLFKKLNIFVGGGLHKNWRHANHEYALKADAGISGILGAEVTFGKVNISWDYIPSLNVLGGDTHFQHQSAVSLRMVIVPNKKKERKWKFWKKEKSKKQIRQERRAKRKKARKKKKSKESKSWNWRFWE